MNFFGTPRRPLCDVSGKMRDDLGADILARCGPRTGIRAVIAVGNVHLGVTLGRDRDWEPKSGHPRYVPLQAWQNGETGSNLNHSVPHVGITAGRDRQSAQTGPAMAVCDNETEPSTGARGFWGGAQIHHSHPPGHGPLPLRRVGLRIALTPGNTRGWLTNFAAAIGVTANARMLRESWALSYSRRRNAPSMRDRWERPAPLSPAPLGVTAAQAERQNNPRQFQRRGGDRPAIQRHRHGSTATRGAGEVFPRQGGARRGMAGLGLARRGSARRGMARRGARREIRATQFTRHGKAWLGAARRGSARLGLARRGSARRGMARQGTGRGVNTRKLLI